MEKGPEFKIVGRASEEAKQSTIKHLEDALFHHLDSVSLEETEEIYKFEIPKTPEQVRMIEFANKEINELRKKFGLESYDVPIENFHILPAEVYYKLEPAGEDGFADSTLQGIFLNYDKINDHPLSFGLVCFHELLHLKSNLKIEAYGNHRDARQDGLRMKSSLKDTLSGRSHEHFRGLDESIVEGQTKKMIGKILALPGFEKKKELMESDLFKSLCREVCVETGIPEDDFQEIIKDDEGWYHKSCGYLSQRKTLEYVIDKILEDNTEVYKSEDEVFDEFLRAEMTGKVLPIARLVEKSFGKGSFRILGNMGAGENEGDVYLDQMRKLRIQAVKK